MSSDFTLFFDTSTVDTTSKGFGGSVFDCRYVYFVPYIYAQVTRYDAALPFTNTVSYIYSIWYTNST